MDKSLIDGIARKLVDEGLLIEAGWVSLKMMAVPKTAPQIQVDEMRNAFFAGAHHLFAGILSFLEAGQEPTEKDLHRMTQVNDELNRFIETYKKKLQI